MKASTVLTVAALSGIPVLTALGLALTLHHPRELTFTDQGVSVAMHLSDDGDRLLTTFTPQRPGFHVYSVGLPADGIHGLGRPTRVEVDGALRSRGPLTAEAPIRMLPMRGTDLAFPVYPDGPVTTDLPVAVDEHGDARVLVSYAACSPQECLRPVTSHPVEIPAAALAAMR
ncbi:hypothetical protein [Catenulispora subtropica]|uniref:Thiol:disulfide interchange protein DsbD N-terminal domain-containing protein n=1 Tax=Catenulispora subtropica TaxID=450798 RepID=A0ABP5EU50_9ACTN